MKKKRYKSLSLARAAFMSTRGFHSCLREALREIKRASYEPPSTGVGFGKWTYRNRNFKRRSQQQLQ
ncbi:hypothetical protein CRE_06135 [Caenorhabditis remanei]|uniref:Uncharacterized protein n=1 Tax=Caenorhabditis remanei TaxID=31234 RepID=E3NED3_CAERE|nr:hypothetical protein CRE_06135 [Caenorhabditis remanei]